MYMPFLPNATGDLSKTILTTKIAQVAVRQKDIVESGEIAKKPHQPLTE